MNTILALIIPAMIWAWQSEKWNLTGATDKNKSEIERTLEKVDNVKSAKVDVTMQTVTVEAKSGKGIDDKAVENALAKIKGITAVKSITPAIPPTIPAP